MSKPWTSDEWGARIQEELYRRASKPSAFLDLVDFPPRSRWQRAKSRVGYFFYRWLPRVHFGPCDHEGCE